MTQEDRNVELVRAAYRAFERRDIPGLVELMAEDVEWVQPGPPEQIPSAGRRIGRQGVAEYFQAIGDTFDIEDFLPSQFVAQGDMVVVLGHYRRRVKSTGKLDESDWVHIFSVRDGRIAGHRGFADTAATLTAMEAA